MESGSRFSRCLLEQRNDESRRANRLHRRTVLIAILIQAVVLGLLMLRPLLGAAADQLMVARFIPLPPWKGAPGSAKPEPPRPASAHHIRLENYTVPPHIWMPAAPHDVDVNCDDAPDIGPDIDVPGGQGIEDQQGLLPAMGFTSSFRPAPPAPPREVDAPPRKPKFVPSDLQQALLVTRIDPVYPVLAKQIRLEGTVVIRAIIAKDGSVQSAEILSGHPLLSHAAMDAIVQWRYRPTSLRGEPIEVETLITVIFKMHE